MAAGSRARWALRGALAAFVTEGEGIVRRTDEVAPLTADAHAGGEEAALLVADAVLTVGCMTSHARGAQA